MKKIASYFFVFIFVGTVLAQDGFRYTSKKNKGCFPFKLINNLVFIPIKVNGTELTFLLDTGVEETILFGLEDHNGINFKNTDKIKLVGLGNKDSFEGLRSTDNVLQVEEIVSKNHLLYIILDSEFNLSSHVGIPVNGIVGYSFFRNCLVGINYAKKKIIFYKDNQKNRKRIERKYVKVPLIIEKAKPYVNGVVVLDSVKTPVKLLLDNGNSDAIWLFQNVSKEIMVPEKHFEDFLGQGLSGIVEGKRARITKFILADFTFKSPIVSYPDSLSIKNIKLVSGRVGSLGGEILKRFSVIFDFSNNLFFLRKNRNYYTPFTYNKSGIEIDQVGMQWINEKVSLQTLPLIEGKISPELEKNKSNFKYEFKLKPVFEISNIRKDSPALKSGLQVGDVIVSINDNPAYKFTLEEINTLLRVEEEKWIEIEIERNKQKLKFKFQLVNLL